MSFEAPASVSAAAAARCQATAPDAWQIGCDLEHGHAGAHRSNMVIWNDPVPTDLRANTDAWVDGQVVLADEREPDIFDTRDAA